MKVAVYALIYTGVGTVNRCQQYLGAFSAEKLKKYIYIKTMEKIAATNDMNDSSAQ